MDVGIILSPVAEDEHQEHLVWVTLESEQTYYPEFFYTKLSEPKDYVMHVATDIRNQSRV